MKIQKIIVKNAHINVWRVFFTPTEEKYTETTYTSVSDEPIITDAARQAKESGDSLSNSSFAIAREPEPDIGLNTSSGNISSGTPTLHNSGDSTRQIMSTAPDEVNIPIPTISKISVGKSPTATVIPFFAPSIKSPNEFLSKTKISPIVHSNSGIIIYEKNCIKTPVKIFL